MQIIDAAAGHKALEFPALIAALRDAFSGAFEMPQRQLFPLDQSQEFGDSFALLPAWNAEVIGVKIFTHYPSNRAQGRETVAAQVLLFDRKSGLPMALVEGSALTLWRTAAASALAATYLARPDAETLLVCGTGKLAPFMALAHASVRPIKEIYIWGRSHDAADATADHIQKIRPDISCELATNLKKAAGSADIISCATGAHQPILYGDWVQPGTHVDLVGNHNANFRECDTELIVKSRVYVDSYKNTFSEAGELILPVQEGVFSLDSVEAELKELCQNNVPMRSSAGDITLYKSVGTALADLAAAHLVFKTIERR